MTDLITIKSGALGDREAMPKLSESELGYITDKKELHIGTSVGNERLCGAGDVAEINAKNAEINAKIAEINSKIANINARLDALETPSE